MVVLSVKQLGMPAMDEDRLIDIETKMAHQEQLLSELNDALTDQQGQISRLESLCQSLIDRLKSLAEHADPSGDERPPHY
jgi:SlyX protein